MYITTIIFYDIALSSRGKTLVNSYLSTVKVLSTIMCQWSIFYIVGGAIHKGFLIEISIQILGQVCSLGYTNWNETRSL